MKKLKMLLLIIVVMVIFPNVVKAEADFDKLLTDGKLVINSVKPTNDEAAYMSIYEYGIMDTYPNYYINWGDDGISCNADYSKCTIYYGENHQPNSDERKEVEMVWNYDNDVKTVVDTLISKLNGKTTFNLNELEFINYLINYSDDSSLINYSSEFKKVMDYKNFSIDVREGDDSPFYTERGGVAAFTYNGIIYYIAPIMIANAKHIIYVPSDTTDVLSAIKERLVKNFGQDFNVMEKGTIVEFLESERQGYISRYSQESYLQSQYNSAEDYATEMMNEAYYNENGYYHFVIDTNIYEKYYALTINDEEFNFLAVKDSSKINDNVNLITSDVGSNVTISANANSIPLDTLISVARLTSGAEYDKIVKLLDTTNIDMYDLKLFSKSTGNYITKLNDGTFEVKLPLTDKLKGKNLIVYYIDENGKRLEYEVVEKDGYAVFNTDHFSIYTLAEKVNNNVNPTRNEEQQNISNNPQTGDNLISNITMLIVSVLVLVCTTIICYKIKHN